MEVNSIANLATTMATTGNRQAVNVAVLDKALDLQAVSAAAMLQMLPPVTSANQPAHLGQNINTTA